MFSKWLSAFRLRTLPLALSSIILGTFLAASVNKFNLYILLLSVLTATFLQILSNLANDYGDSIHGADSVHRKGPKRAVQTGEISSSQMKIAIGIFGVLALLSGISLLAVASSSTNMFLTFLGIGVLAIIAAITYTAGPKPYGYAGLGDISVFIFFGLVGVFGSYYLYTNSFEWQIIFPAISCGLFSVGVLNINNMRDIDSDKLAGKISIPVRLGLKNAKSYHIILILGGFVSALLYSFLTDRTAVGYYYIVLLGLFGRQLVAIWRIKESYLLDPFLKQLAIGTLLFCVAFGMSILYDGKI